MEICIVPIVGRRVIWELILGGMRGDISGLSIRNQTNQVDGMFGEEVSKIWHW